MSIGATYATDTMHLQPTYVTDDDKSDGDHDSDDGEEQNETDFDDMKSEFDDFLSSAITSFEMVWLQNTWSKSGKYQWLMQRG
jgi:hypothetical protein